MPPAPSVESLAPAPEPGNIVRVLQIGAIWERKRQSMYDTTHGFPVPEYLIPYGVLCRMERSTA